MILRATWYQQVPSTTEISFWRGGGNSTLGGVEYRERAFKKAYTPLDDFDLEKLKKEKANVIFVSHGKVCICMCMCVYHNI